ncbi:unnamed protein product [Closterium sp. Yama58-4]|nr:unnamed protein product [Closterium sp. Yama58-4]
MGGAEGGVGGGGPNEEATGGNQGGPSVSGGSGSGISLAAAAAAAATPPPSAAAAAAAAAADTGRAAALGSISSLAAFPRFSTNSRTPAGALGAAAASAAAAGGGAGGGGGVAAAPALAGAGYSRAGLIGQGGDSDRKRAAEEELDGQALIPHKRQRAPAKPAGSEIPPDGWEWRKYGQKATLGQLYPRSYFRCAFRGGGPPCMAKKWAERCNENPSNWRIKYMSEHNHAKPPPRPVTITIVHDGMGVDTSGGAVGGPVGSPLPAPVEGRMSLDERGRPGERRMRVEMRDEEMRGEEMRDEEMRGEEMRGEEMRDEEMRRGGMRR